MIHFPFGKFSTGRDCVLAVLWSAFCANDSAQNGAIIVEKLSGVLFLQEKCKIFSMPAPARQCADKSLKYMRCGLANRHSTDQFFVVLSGSTVAYQGIANEKSVSASARAQPR
jgi:hypothetical protein